MESRTRLSELWIELEGDGGRPDGRWQDVHELDQGMTVVLEDEVRWRNLWLVLPREELTDEVGVKLPMADKPEFEAGRQLAGVCRNV